jgi:DNA-binding FadR family transcriptional regulator
MLRPIPPRQGAANACANQLRDAIVRNEWAVGSRLPPERSLAETLGVNRATVRTALHELETVGLVTARQGSGYTVCDYRDRGGPDLLGSLADVAREEGTLFELATDLLMVRRQLARGVLERLMARKPSRAAMAQVEARIDAMERLAQAGASVDALAAADFAVLEGLLEVIDSAVLRLFFNPAVSVLLRVPELLRAMYAEPLANVLGWRAVLMLVRARDMDVDAIVTALAAEDEKTVQRLKRRK